LEGPDERERSQHGDVRAGGGECIVGQRPLWAVLLQMHFDSFSLGARHLFQKLVFFYEFQNLFKFFLAV
jgi:hypothetical protein